MMNSFSKQFTRLFSSSNVQYSREYKSVVNRQIKFKPEYKVGDLRDHKVYISKKIEEVPEYPYGEARIFKRSDRGLYGGQVISFGNKVSEMGNKTRRDWLPNVITKTLWSEKLNKMIKLKLTARVLRTIVKEGGLDNYLIKDKEARIKELGLFGWNLRFKILKQIEKSKIPLNFKIVENEKIYFQGNYKGELINLKIGKRKLIEILYPFVKNESIEELSFSKYNIERASKSIDEIIAECEKHDIDLSAYCL